MRVRCWELGWDMATVVDSANDDGMWEVEDCFSMDEDAEELPYGYWDAMLELEMYGVAIVDMAMVLVRMDND